MALSGLVDFGISSLILVGMMVYYQVKPSWELLLLPILIIPLLFLVLGIGMILAALNVKYRDIKYAIPFIIQIWLFVTPIIYPTSIIPERFRILTVFNPLGGIIEAFRASLLPTRQIDWQLLGISTVATGFIFVLGMMCFRKAERTFSDII